MFGATSSESFLVHRARTTLKTYASGRSIDLTIKIYQLRWAYTNRETVGIPLSQKISGVMVDVMCRLQQATTRRQPTLATRGNLTVASTWRDLDLNYYFSTHSTDITLNCACQSTLQNVVCRPTRPDITAALTWWHCLHCMHSRVYEMVRCPSVRLSVRPCVCPSMGPRQKTRHCMFAAVGPAGRVYRSIAAASADDCGQCHVVSIHSS